MALGGETHRQDVVGEVGRLVPGRRQSYVQPHLGLVAEHLDPREAVRVRPDRVVDAAEIDVEALLRPLHQVGKQKGQLVHGERELDRPGQVVPVLRMARQMDGARNEFVPGIGVEPARCRHRTQQRVEHEERAGDLPATFIGGGGATPVVGRQARAGGGDDLRHLSQDFRLDSRLLSRVLERVALVLGLEQTLEALEGRIYAGVLFVEVLLPIPPASHVVAVVELVPDQVVGDRQMDGGFGAGLRRQPEVGVGGGVRKPSVEDDELGALLLGLDDALGVGVEIVPCLEVSADQEDDLGAGVVGTGPVDPGPVLVSGAGSRGADVGMRIVRIAAPGGHHPLREAVFAGPADVVHDLFLSTLLDGFADTPRDVVDRLLPADPFPLARAAISDPSERVQDAIGIGDLIQRRRSLGAVAAARAGVLGIAFELGDFERGLVDVGQQAARRFAVETGGGHQHEPLLDPLRPGLRVELDPVVPALLGWERSQVDAAGTRVEGLTPRLGLRASGADSLIEVLDAHGLTPRLEVRPGLLVRRRVRRPAGRRGRWVRRSARRSRGRRSLLPPDPSPTQKKVLKRPPVISWVAALAWAVVWVSVISPRIIRT